MDGQYHMVRQVEAAEVRLERLVQDGSGPFERAHCVDHPSLVYLRHGSEGPALGCLGHPSSHRSFAPFGTAILVPAHVSLHVRSPGFSPREMIILRFDEARFRDLTGIDHLSSAAQLKACVDLRVRGVLAPMNILARELARPDSSSATIVAGLGLMILGEVARHFASLDGGDALARGELAPWQIARIEARLSEEHRPSPAIDELAAICGIGRRHLMRAYKASAGMTVMERVARKVFDRATAMLLENELPLKVIADRLGYSSQSSFSTAFRRRMGVTPNQWRIWHRADRVVELQNLLLAI